MTSSNLDQIANLVPANTTTNETVAVGGSRNGTIDFSGDEDWYEIQLTAGQTYEFSLYGSGGTPLSDPYLYLYDVAGSMVASNDDGGAGYNSLLNFTASSSGTYYLGAAAYSTEIGDYTLSASTSTPSGPTDALDWGSHVSGNTVDVYFAAAGEVFDGETSDGWDAYEIAQAMNAFEQISNVADLTFNHVATAAGSDFQLVLNNDNPGFLGYFNPPGEVNAGVGVFTSGGTGWESGGGGGLEQGGYGFVTLIHEFGHGVGLAHPHDNGGTSDVMDGVFSPFNSYGTHDLNQGVFTTMSYNDGWATAPHGTPDSLDYGYQGTMMALDIAVLQEKYGANTSFNTGDDIYLLPGANMPGTFYSAIWHAGGTDTIEYGGSLSTTIDLRPASLLNEPGGGGFISYATGVHGGFTIADGVVIENANGGGGNDAIVGNDATNRLNGNGGIDTLVGGLGADTLLGQRGTDYLRGDAGDDLLFGGEQNDRLLGNGHKDTLHGNAGNDVLFGGGGGDKLYGNGQSDKLYGGNHSDRLYGGGHGDRLFGGADRDFLFGGGGKDVLKGNSGNDKLVGGRNVDVALYNGNKNAYTVTKIGAGKYKVVDDTGASSVDILSGIEQIKIGGTNFDIADLLA